MKKSLFCMLICCVLLAAAVFPCLAAEQQVERLYDPLDIVVVVDSSGSMKDSDPDRTAVAAVRMLVNMMPADSRVGVIGFNTKATVWTQDAAGNPALLPVESFADAESVRSAIAKIRYSGDTGIGNAILRATELLAEQNQPGRQKAVMLFTDGVDDFGLDRFGLAQCQENEVDAMQWAKENNTPIYCVGYNYQKPDGTYSMGANGEGLVKLENIAKTTNGKFRSISTVKEAEQLLVDFLADVCDLIYRPVATIPGDGGYHEVTIPVSPSVVEANIRIVGGDANTIKNGDIHLYDPDGKEIELKNSGNVRYDVDVNAASIKIIMPRAGDWLLTVKNISGEDVHIGLLEHFKMNLCSTLTFPEGNPAGVAYTNDQIGIKAWLSYDQNNLTDVALYDAVTSATATCISRENPDEKKVIDLVRNGLAFEGSFVIPEDAYYDVVIRLEWDSVYREDTQEVKSNNKPLQLVNGIKTVSVNKGKTVTVDDIYQYVADDENDQITAVVTSLTTPDAATITVSGNQIVITGNKWSSTLATVTYTDAQGNTVDTTFKVRVNDPVAVALIIGGIVLIALAVLFALAYSAYESLKVKGNLYLISIEFDTTSDEDGDLVPLSFTEDSEMVAADPNALVIPMNTFYRKKENRNVGAILAAVKKMFLYAEPDTPGATVNAFLGKNSVKLLLTGAERSRILGSPTGDSFTVKVHKKTPHLRINHSDKVRADNNRLLTFEFRERGVPGKHNKVTLVMKFVTPVHTRRKHK